MASQDNAMEEESTAYPETFLGYDAGAIMAWKTSTIIMAAITVSKHLPWFTS